MKVKIIVPTDLSEIKLSQYQKFIKTTKGSEDVEYINRQLVGIFCNLSNEIVGKMERIKFNKIVDILSETLTKDAKFKPTFWKDDVKYGFIPNLQKITVDEQADAELFLKDLQTYDKAMAVLFRPIVHDYKGKYLVEEYNGKGEGLDVSLDIVHGATAFFLNLQNDLVNCILNYIPEQLEKNQNLKQILEENGVGIKSITDLRKVTYLDLMKSVN